MAAILFSTALLAAQASMVCAEQGKPRRYPELLELMQDRGSESSVQTANYEEPAWAKSPGTSAKPASTTSPIIQASATSEAWPAYLPPARSSRLSEPVAAPPATPLAAPPDLAETTIRRTASSAEHTLTVREPDRSSPLLIPDLPEPANLQPSHYEYNAVTPPVAFAGDDTSLQPIPQAPPEPESASTDQQPIGQVLSSEPFYEGDASYEDGMAYDMGYGPCEDCVEDRCAYRNLFPPDMCQETDPCGEFLPFGNLGIKAGNERVITGGGFFIPLWQSCDSMIFTDLRGSVDDHHSGDGYFGLGYRTYMDPQWIFGTYIYADLIATNQKNVFGQAQLGFELLSLNWDFRINGYAPGTATQEAVTQSGISNGTVVTRDFRERAYSGFDIEIGQRILNWGWNDQYEVRWFLGGYGFGKSSDTFPSFGGPRGRIEMRIYDLPWAGQQSRIETGVEASYDRVRDGQIFGYIRARIPFGPKQGRPALDPMRRRMVDTPIHRVD
ncbi:inverse autotransporter beta domain-containing protein [Planctomicrobium sp. SH661]|uniref:inverse autotransporter beta domain-containing protein n=1 Tax=Planctomicrobium sp. SH661 TaxID=3448124 RepID=UPI003F5B0504